MPTTITGTSISVPSGGITRGSLPSGSVIQTQYVSSATRVTSNAGTFTEPSTNYRVTITPTSTTSVIILRYFIPSGFVSSYQPYYVHKTRAFRMVSGTKSYNITSSGTNNSNRPGHSGITLRPSNGYDGNDPFFLAFDAIDIPGTTSAVTYGFEFASGGGTLSFGYMGPDVAYGYDTNVTITAMEVAA